MTHPAVSIEQLLTAAAQYKASDLHVRSEGAPRLRISGVLRSLTGLDLTPDQVDDLVKGTMSTSVLKTFESSHEADYAISLPGIGRFRVNAFRTRERTAAVFRRISDEPLSLETLAMPKIVADLALRHRGLVLVTGPTGSGKSTTLSAMVDLINTERPVHILTIEDPIETVHTDKLASVSQRELHTDTRDWGTAMKQAMREDPDVILIGEMRDKDTVQAAIAASETGHFVMSTLHTTDALETVTRIIDFFQPHEHKHVRAALAATLQGVVCQRLVPRADNQGRVAVMEIMTNSGRVVDAIAEPDKTELIPQIIEESGTTSGMQTFDQHLLRLVADGIVTYEVACKAASKQQDFMVVARQRGLIPTTR